VASLYVSRVVHPNYLVPAAVLLPAAALAQRRIAADMVVVPLTLLAVAVEISEQELFRSPWEQASATGLDGSLGAFGPRAGTELTMDPIGLALSGITAGLAVLYLALAGIEAGRRLRQALLVAALVVVVAAPTLLMIELGRRGVDRGAPLRGQHPWWGSMTRESVPAGAPLPRAREAWATSFRREPPAAVDEGSAPPAAPAAGAVLRWTGLVDPRVLTLMAYAACVLMLLRLTPPGAPAGVVGAVLLTPAAALGTVFGAPWPLSLLGVLVALRLVQTRRRLLGGFALGTAGALVPSTLWTSPFVLRPPSREESDGDARTPEAESGRGWARGWAGLGLGFLLLALPAILRSAAGAGRGTERTEPAVGLTNLLLCYGLAPPGAWLAAALCVAAVLVARRRLVGAGALSGAAAISATWLFLSPAAAPDDVAFPIALLAFSDRRRPAPRAPARRDRLHPGERPRRNRLSAP
jgi:hypothetical protein